MMIDTIRKNIETIRIERGLSQEGMVAKMKKTQSAYARFESGKTKIDLNTIDTFARVNNMTVIDVITYPKKFIDSEELCKLSQIDASIMFHLPADKKPQVLKLLFGDKVSELL